MTGKTDIQSAFDNCITQESLGTHFSHYKEDNKENYAKIFNKSILVKYINESKDAEDTFNKILKFINAKVDFERERTEEKLKPLLLILKEMQDSGTDNNILRVAMTLYKESKALYEGFQQFLKEYRDILQSETAELTQNHIRNNILRVKLPETVIHKYKAHMQVVERQQPVKARGVLEEHLRKVVAIHNAEVKVDKEQLKELLDTLEPALADHHKVRLYDAGIKLERDIELTKIEEYLIENNVGVLQNSLRYTQYIVEMHGHDMVSVTEEKLLEVIPLVDKQIEEEDRWVPLTELGKYLEGANLGNNYTLERYTKVLQEELGDAETQVQKEYLAQIVPVLDKVIELENSVEIQELKNLMLLLEDNRLINNSIYSKTKTRLRTIQEVANKTNQVAAKVLQGGVLNKEECAFLGLDDYDRYIPQYISTHLMGYAKEQFQTIQKYDLQQEVAKLATLSEFIKGVNSETTLEQVGEMREVLKAVEHSAVHAIISVDLTEIEFYINDEIAKKKKEQERIAQEKKEQERLAQEKKEQQRLEQERIEKERREKEQEQEEQRLEQERVAKEKQLLAEEPEVAPLYAETEPEVVLLDVIAEEPEPDAGLTAIDLTNAEMDMLLKPIIQASSLLDALYGGATNLSQVLTDYVVAHTTTNIDFYNEILQDVVAQIPKKKLSESDIENTFHIIDTALNVASSLSTVDEFSDAMKEGIASIQYRDTLTALLVNKLEDVTLLPIKVKEQVSKYDIPVHTSVTGVQNPVRTYLESTMYPLPTTLIEGVTRAEVTQTVYDELLQHNLDYYGFSTDEVVVRIKKETINISKILEGQGTLILTLDTEYGMHFNLKVSADLPERSTQMGKAKEPIELHMLKHQTQYPYHSNDTGVHTLLSKDVQGIHTVYLQDIVPFTMKEYGVKLHDISDSPVPLDVEMAVKQSLMQPIDDTVFYCEGNVTKKQVLFGIAKALGHIPVVSETWYDTSLTYLESRGVVDSVVKENFELDTYTTREELCYVLNNIFTNNEKGTQVIKDIDQVDGKYQGSVRSIINKGVVPINIDEIQPKEKVTREELAFYLVKIRKMVVEKV